MSWCRKFALTNTYPQLEWMPVTMSLADRAAELRARYRLSTLDAIQLATAIDYRASRFYGNDRSLRKVKEIECVMVDDVI
jgi:predicted nucleic acid-binding protein